MPARPSGAAGWVTAALRWTLIILCALVIGPVAAMLLSHVRDVDGGHAVSMLISESVGSSVVGVGVVLLVAAAIATFAAKVFSPTVAFPCAALIVGWGAWHTGTLDDMIRRSRSGSELPVLAAENGLIVAFAVVVAVLITRFSRQAARRAAAEQEKASSTSATSSTSPLLACFGSVEKNADFMKMLIATVAGSAVAAGLAGYLGAATMAKGQAVFAALLAGIASGIAGQMISRSQRGFVTPALLILAGIAPAIAAPIVAKFMHGDKIVAATFAGNVFPLARIMCLDWGCGLLLGVPIGMGWAGAMIDEHLHR